MSIDALLQWFIDTFTTENISKWFVDNFSFTTEQVRQWFIYDPNHPLLFNSSLFLGLFLVFYLVYIISVLFMLPYFPYSSIIRQEVTSLCC